MFPKSMKIDPGGARAPSGTPGAALGYPRGAPDAKITPKLSRHCKKISITAVVAFTVKSYT